MMYNNVLLFSDCHNNDYANYNRSKESRLNQTRILTDLLIQAGIDYNCDRFILAGDLTEIPVMKNNVLTETTVMLRRLCEFYKLDNYYILGQHDLSVKDQAQDLRYSGIPSIAPPNLIYADMKQFELCGRNVAMMNWKPNQDLSWINGKVDLFVGHVTLAPPNANYKGQSIDKSKFKLSITGDIHRHFSIGKMVSIGSCIQNKLGDQCESTAIVWNPNDNSWKCINLDPNNRLLKLRYTSNRELEGFDPNENFYNVYRPINFNKNNGSDVINVPKWSEISMLVDDIIHCNGLDQVHSEVLRNCRFEDDVDFNFTPIKLRLKNFRSISELEVFFDDMDKISISGNNGAGKSSLILGLYNALRENRSLKDFIKFGETECECEIEFIYQGVNNKILRGTKDYGCWVNGEKLPYNNKREFEDDMLRRYQFLNYIDIYFFNADRSTILGSMNPERKSELISKIFRINKVDSYNATANAMMNEINRYLESRIDELNRSNELVMYLGSQLSAIVLPNESKESLSARYSDMLAKQKEYTEYINFKSTIDKMEGTMESYDAQIAELNNRLKSMDTSKLESADRINDQFQSVIRELSQIDGYVRELNQLNASIDKINKDGSNLYDQLLKVQSGKCPTCGSSVVLKDLEVSLQNQIGSLVESRKSMVDRVNELNSMINDEYLNNLKAEKSRLESEMNQIYATKSAYENNKIMIDGLNKKRLDLSKSMSSIKEDRTFSITSLPDDFYSRLNDVASCIKVWDDYYNLTNQYSEAKMRYDNIESSINESKNSLSILNKYIKLTSSTGDIYKEIMTRISSEFSDNIIRYEVNKYKFRNKDHLDLDVQYNVAGRWVSYQSLSSGQKTMADINFLSRILVECGLLVFDETLKHLSQSSMGYCLDIMSRMNVHVMLLTTHMYGTESFANKNINLELDSDGSTRIEMR